MRISDIVLRFISRTVLQTNKATEIWKIYSELVNDQMNDFIPFSIRCFEIILTTHFLCHYNYCFYRCDPSLEALYISSTAVAEGPSSFTNNICREQLEEFLEVDDGEDASVETEREPKATVALTFSLFLVPLIPLPIPLPLRWLLMARTACVMSACVTDSSAVECAPWAAPAQSHVAVAFGSSMSSSINEQLEFSGQCLFRCNTKITFNDKHY